MRHRTSSQRGAVMVVALIMIVIISVVAVSAYMLSTSNLRAVGNVQVRQEAIASANQALEAVVSGPFLTALNTTAGSTVDIDKDGNADYSVSVQIPQCPLRVRRVSLDAPSGFETGENAVSAGTYIVDWELRATVSDPNSGATAVIRHGLRLPMGEADYQMYVVPCGLTLIAT
jgi:hypothetical protein